jgi:hypothetical protein
MMIFRYSFFFLVNSMDKEWTKLTYKCREEEGANPFRYSCREEEGANPFRYSFTMHC